MFSANSWTGTSRQSVPSLMSPTAGSSGALVALTTAPGWMQPKSPAPGARAPDQLPGLV